MNNYTNTKSSTQLVTYPAGLLASLLGCWGVGFCCWFWPLITTDSQLLSVVVPAEACSNQSMVQPLTFRNKKSSQKMTARGRCPHSLYLLLHISILVNQMRNLLLQTVILFHQQFVHRSQLSVHCLQPRSFLPLLLTTPTHQIHKCLVRRKAYKTTSSYIINWGRHKLLSFTQTI